MAAAPRIERLEDVPADVVEKIVASFESEGAEVTKRRQSDGNWTIIADFTRAGSDAS